jgi:hypothetical protein
VKPHPREIEGFLKLSKSFLPEGVTDLFSLRTKDRFEHEGKTIQKGSYLVVASKERAIVDGELRIFTVDGFYEMRKCHVSDRVCLTRVSGVGIPIFCTVEEAEDSCVGSVKLILPIP